MHILCTRLLLPGHRRTVARSTAAGTGVERRAGGYDDGENLTMTCGEGETHEASIVHTHVQYTWYLSAGLTL